MFFSFTFFRTTLGETFSTSVDAFAAMLQMFRECQRYLVWSSVDGLRNDVTDEIHVVVQMSGVFIIDIRDRVTQIPYELSLRHFILDVGRSEVHAGDRGVGERIRFGFLSHSHSNGVMSDSIFTDRELFSLILMLLLLSLSLSLSLSLFHPGNARRSQTHLNIINE